MENLNLLSKDLLISIIMEQDEAITMINDTAQGFFNQIEAQQDIIEDMEDKRNYWRSRFNELNALTFDHSQVRRIVTRAEVIAEGLKDPIDDIKEETESKGTQGNLQHTPHSAHKTKKELLYAKFPNGDVMSFDTVEECKEEVRARVIKFKDSTLTNISKAARCNGKYYGCKFTYDIELTNKWLGESNGKEI